MGRGGGDSAHLFAWRTDLLSRQRPSLVTLPKSPAVAPIVREANEMKMTQRFSAGSGVNQPNQSLRSWRQKTLSAVAS